MDAERFINLISRYHPGEEKKIFSQKWPHCEMRAVGSSLKFCQIAAGEADLYVKSQLTKAWDTAAAQCVLEEAGGKLVDFDGQDLNYKRDSLTNPKFIAFGDQQVDWRKFI